MILIITHQQALIHDNLMGKFLKIIPLPNQLLNNTQNDNQKALLKGAKSIQTFLAQIAIEFLPKEQLKDTFQFVRNLLKMQSMLLRDTNLILESME